MDINTSIFNILSAYQLPAIFIGVLFFGETVIIAAAFLATQGVWPLENVFWLSLAGTVISDSLWFFFGQHFFKITRRWKNYQRKYGKLLKKMEKASGKRPFLSLLFIKFLYGIRILAIIYLSLRKISFRLFLVFDAIGTILWLAVIISIGWLAGKGIANIIPIFNKVEYALLPLILLVIIFKIITLWAKKRIVKE